jgi:uncharacterized protein YecE (DUF72 family)
VSDFPLFNEPPELAPQAARLAPRLRKLAEKGVFFGTSSWKYEGWLGSIYRPDRYLTRGKLSKKKFEAECLAEYAQVFPTVCGDFAFYQFPTPEFWRGLFDQTPTDFEFAFKVPEEITVAKWPSHPRYGARAGAMNEHFLNNDILNQLFLKRLHPYAYRVGCLILEFGTFAKATFAKPEHFYAALEPFLEGLPRGNRFGIEIRNPEYLTPAYFHLLARHNVAHVFNAWTRMPSLSDQAQLSDAHTADFVIARALLTKGRSYEQAVKSFVPYERIQEPNESARLGLCSLARAAIQKQKPAYLFINNRLEGNAPGTIEAVLDLLGD